MNKIIQGDCLEELKKLEDNSVDAVVTDPPYGLSFMGKKWDYDVPSVEIWSECLRVLKPGGYLLAFAGTRTQHRMAVRIEDAGFEIRDMIAWVYGSGFPKSLNISKQIDKQDTEDFRKQVGFVIKEARNKKGLSMDELCNSLELNNSGHGGMVNHYENGRATPTLELWEKICEVLDINDLQDYEEIKKGRTEIIGEIKNPISWFGKGIKEIATTEQAKQWEGWGTALKPALEPITVARKPLIGTVAENVLKYGTGGINIDGCRVGTDNKLSQGASNLGYHGVEEPTKTEQHVLGRFPANLIHDGSEEVIGLFPVTGKSSGGGMKRQKKNDKTYGEYGLAEQVKDCGFGDSGNASRFFYCAKASKSERNKGCEGLEIRGRQGKMMHKANNTSDEVSEGFERFDTQLSSNNHPTIKPIALMEYLIKLVSRENAVILDPFAGSGSTGVACKNLNRNYILIEREPDYVEIIKKRIESIEPKLFP